MSGAASALSHHDTDVCANAWDLYAAPAGQKCKVQLLKPSAVLSRRSYSAPVTPPIGAAYLAATLERAGYSVGLIDAVGEAITRVTPSPCGTYNIQGLSAREILERIDPDAMVL